MNQDLENFPVVKDEPAGYIKSKKGQNKLLDSHCYTYFSINSAKEPTATTYWRCTEYRKKKCKSTAKVKGNIIVETTPHCHFSDQGSLLAQQARSKVLENARAQPTVSTAVLVNQYCQEVGSDSAIVAKSLKLKSIEREIQAAKSRSLDHPNAPKAFSDLAVIPSNYFLFVEHIIQNTKIY